MPTTSAVNKPVYEDGTPNPEYLIKSIAEQGYSLETALADLMDNSVANDAKRIEILIDRDIEPYALFLADDGNGMDVAELKKAMHFPSESTEASRANVDLGRFGLGLKTASFSQTRRFTVISRKKGKREYAARTWDVAILKATGAWRILIPEQSAIDNMIAQYRKLSKSFLNSFDSFEANTIVIWEGLYKFEEFIETKNRKAVLNKELDENTCNHLSLVFHRFLEHKEEPLRIRVNNQLLSAFNPFPVNEVDFRQLEFKQRRFGNDSIKIEGFVLPARSIDEVKNGANNWAPKNHSLMDMEGIYIYRLNRLILYGGWNGLTSKNPRLQLARLRVEIGNNADHLMHLNVAKSRVIIPHDLKPGFESYVIELKNEAEREFYNRGIRRFDSRRKENRSSLFVRRSSNKGPLLEINQNFELLRILMDSSTPEQLSQIRIIVRMVNTAINKMRQNHEDKSFAAAIPEELSPADLVAAINTLLSRGIEPELIKREIIAEMGYDSTTLPDEVIELLAGGSNVAE